MLTQNEPQKTFLEPHEPKVDNVNEWRFYSDQIVLHRQRNTIDLLIDILNDPFSDELRDYAVAMDEKARAAKIQQLDEQRKKIDFSNANGKLDSRSKMEEALAIVFANRILLAEKVATEEISTIDINSSILAELIEEVHFNREKTWATEDAHVIPTAKENFKVMTSEFENRTSEDIWNLIVGKLNSTRAALSAELNDLASDARDALMAEQLMAAMGETAWKMLSERERQRKVFELKRLEAANRKDAVGMSAIKVLADFNGNEEAYAKYLQQQKIMYKKSLNEKIERLKSKKAESEEEKIQIKEELEEALVLKKTLEELAKYDLDSEKEKLKIIQNLEEHDSKLTAERNRQMLSLKMKIQKRKKAEGEIEDTAHWIRFVDEESRTNQEEAKKRQKALARKRLEHLKSQKGKKPESLGEKEPSDAVEKVAFLLDKMHKEETDFVFAIIKQGKYKKSSKSKGW